MPSMYTLPKAFARAGVASGRLPGGMVMANWQCRRLFDPLNGHFLVEEFAQDRRHRSVDPLTIVRSEQLSRCAWTHKGTPRAQ